MGAEGRRRLAKRAAGRFGVFTVEDAARAGVEGPELTRMVRAGTVERLHRGVYRFTAAPRTKEHRLLAAVLAAGPGAVASHTTAAAVWDLGDFQLVEPFHVLVPGRCQRTVAGATVHTASGIDRMDVTTKGVMPVTAPGRTLVDVAGIVAVDVVEDLLVELLRRSLANVATIAAAVGRAPNGAGSGALRRMLRSLDPAEIARLMSWVEGRFLTLVRRHGLPPPQVNRRLHDSDGALIAKVDFVWPSFRLVVEIDGLRWHSTPGQKRYDDDRQNRLVVDGWRVLRFGAGKVRDEPWAVVSTLSRALQRTPA